MAETLTALGAPAGLQTDTFNVVAITGATVGGYCKVNDEYSVITEIPSSNSVVVRSRGSYGGVAAAHPSGSPVVFGLHSDLAQPAAGRTTVEAATPAFQGGYRQRAISADGAVDTSTIRDNTEFNIVKGSLCAITLNQLPKLSQDGLRLRFNSRTAFAHTITCTAGFFSGTATASDVVTLAAAGNTAEFEAQGGKWAVVSGTPA